MCFFWRQWDIALNVLQFSQICFFFILAIDGHKNRSGKRCSGRFVEEGSTKASHRCLSLFSTVKEIVQASLVMINSRDLLRFELETYTLGLPLICFRDYGYGNSTNCFRGLNRSSGSLRSFSLCLFTSTSKKHTVKCIPYS